MSEEGACAYPHGERLPFRSCGARTQAGSPYCPEHHALCYLPIGSKREGSAFKHIANLADLAARRRAPRPQGAWAAFRAARRALAQHLW